MTTDSPIGAEADPLVLSSPRLQRCAGVRVGAHRADLSLNQSLLKALLPLARRRLGGGGRGSDSLGGRLERRGAGRNGSEAKAGPQKESHGGRCVVVEVSCEGAPAAGKRVRAMGV